MPSCPLESFVASQTDGQPIESSSEFTLDSIRARQKLSESQLPRPGLWLVKLIQAANVLKSERLNVSFGKRSVDLEFRCTEWEYEPRQVLAEFLSGSMSSEPFLFHFLTGLRGGLTEDTVACVWSVKRGRECTEVHINSQGTEIKAGELEDSNDGVLLSLSMSRPPRWPGLKRALTMPIKHLLQRTADEFLAVKNFCWSSAVPITLDGRLLKTYYQWSPNETSHGFLTKMEQYAVSSPLQPPPLVVGRHHLPLSETRQPLNIPWTPNTGKSATVEFGDGEARKQTKGFYWGQAWIESVRPEGVPTQATMLLIFGHEMESRVEFVCDGAIVGTQAMPWETSRLKLFGRSTQQNQFKIGLRLLVACSIDQLDLSHFRVRDTALLTSSELSSVGQSIREFTELCLDHSKDYRYPVSSAPESRVGRVGATLGAVAMDLHLPLRLVFWLALKKELHSLLKSLSETESSKEDCDKLEPHDP